MRKLLVVTALLATVAVNVQPSLQAQTTPPAISVENAWARATSPSVKTGAVYLTIVDHGPPDRVTGFATPAADMAQLHETTMQGNVMRMRPIDGLAVNDQGPVTLAPGGYHVMLMGLKSPLRTGQTFPLSVTFQKAGTVQITVAVEAAGAGGPVQSGGVQSGGPGRDTDMHMDMDMGKPMAPPSK